MFLPLEGVRVVEVASFLAAPSAAALMADLGADVIKVEPPDGDATRRFAGFKDNDSQALMQSIAANVEL